MANAKHKKGTRGATLAAKSADSPYVPLEDIIRRIVREEIERWKNYGDPDDAPEMTDEMFRNGTWRIGGKVVDEETGKTAMRDALARRKRRVKE